MALNSTPNASDIISQTQAPIKANFDGIDAGFAIDHVAFGTVSPVVANEGKHKAVRFTQVGAPSAVPNEFAVYNNGADATLYVQNHTGTSYPFSGANSSSGTTNGFTYLPSGIILAWGQTTISFVTHPPTPYPKVVIANMHSIHNVQVSLITTASTPINSVVIANIVNTGFPNNYIEFYTNQNNVSICWFAVGH